MHHFSKYALQNKYTSVCIKNKDKCVYVFGIVDVK